MVLFYVAYVTCRASACLVAPGLFLAGPLAYALTRRAYWRFLGRLWKLITFAAAAAGLVLIAPFTRDPTWDDVDAGVISVLTFCTAPWAVGMLYQRLSKRQSFIALCLWLFSVSWSYDLYFLIRDGYHPVT